MPRAWGLSAELSNAWKLVPQSMSDPEATQITDKTKSAALEHLVLGIDRRGELGDKGVRGNLGGEDLNNQADNRKPGHVIEMQSEVSTRLKRALNTKILFHTCCTCTTVVLR